MGTIVVVMNGDPTHKQYQEIKKRSPILRMSKVETIYELQVLLGADFAEILGVVFLSQHTQVFLVNAIHEILEGKVPVLCCDEKGVMIPA